jgi:hypothetical protein
LVFSPDPTSLNTRFDGKFTAIVLLKDLGGGRTKLEYLFRIDLGRQMQAPSLIRTSVAEHGLLVARHVVIHLKLRWLKQCPVACIESSDVAIFATALLSKGQGSNAG